MIFGLFKRRNPNAAVVDRLYLAIAAASRAQGFYRDLGVPDTVEGRFDMLTLHVALVLRRLATLPAPADELAQDLVDHTFAHFDSALRELGVSDIGVPKKMKTLASAFYGRAKAYGVALEGGTGLEASLLRNVFGEAAAMPDAPARLARYVEDAERLLAGAPFQSFVDGTPPFPDLEPPGGSDR
jgi:cytochrome b pre-mRNA-processing protein 3